MPEPVLPPVLLNRRTLLKQSALGLLGVASAEILTRGSVAYGAPASPASTAKAAQPPATLAPLNRFPRMMQDYMVRRVREVEQDGEARRALLRTKVDAETYVRDVRRRIQDAFGPWPERTPLNARVTGVLERETYHIEKVIFESRPGFPVTANLYVPQGRSGPMPAVVGTCGHSDNGKAGATYQSFAQGLARQGYVVLLFDPLGQGERVQYLTPDFKPRGHVGVTEHNVAGNQQLLVGESLPAWFAWDGIRALDYLLTRPEVDPRHLGVTGNSGGGTQTAWLCGVEPRFTMAAPSCFVITFRRNLENENPADSEQCPARVLALGLDHADFIAALAPKPVILMGQEKDFFDVRGLEEAFGRLQNLYRLLGAEQNIKLFVGPDYHGYSQANREAMYGWFNHVTGRAEQGAESTLTMETDEALRCTAGGQVGEMPARTVFSFTSERSAALRASRPLLAGTALVVALQDALKLPPREKIADYRILRPSTGRRYPKAHATSYAIETEPGVFALVCQLSDQPNYSRPPRGRKRALLYVSHRSADDELRREAWLADLIRTEPEAGIFACDVRGIGESQPNTTGQDVLAPYGQDYMYAVHSLMLDSPYAGQRTHDVLRVIDWLKASGHDEVHLVAKGWGTIPATFAAVLADGVKQVTLMQALTSYRVIAENETYVCPLSAMVPGGLKTFDLPECYAALAAKNLRQIEPSDRLPA